MPILDDTPPPSRDGRILSWAPGRMSRTPIRTRGVDARSLAEKAFQAVTSKPVEAPVERRALPKTREAVSIRIDRDVLDVFQADGPGWQDRINDALRKVVGK